MGILTTLDHLRNCDNGATSLLGMEAGEVDGASMGRIDTWIHKWMAGWVDGCQGWVVVACMG